MQSKEDEILQKRCFACRQYLSNPVDENHIKNCLTNVSLQNQIECKGCYCLVEVVKLFKHLNHKTVKCKATFTVAEINAIEKMCNHENKDNQQHAVSKEEESGKLQNPALTKCKICHIEFERILGHIEKDKKCKAGYGEEELMNLKEKAKVERQQYKNDWKRQKSTSKKERQKCEVCNKAFLSLKQHLKKTPECQKRYSKEQLSLLNKGIEEKLKKKKKDYNAEYHKSHNLDEEMKKEKSFNDKLRYEFYERPCLDLKKVRSVLASKVTWKRDQCLELRDSIWRLFNDSKIKNSHIFEDTNPVFESIETISKELKDELKTEIDSLDGKRVGFGSGNMPNNKLCYDFAESFNTYLTDKFQSMQKCFKNFMEHFDAVPDADKEAKSVQIMFKKEWKHFNDSSKDMKELFLQKYNKAKSQHEERLKLWKLVQGTAKNNQNPMKIFKKLLDVLIPEVKNCLEEFSSWIPNYKLIIEEYKQKEGVTKEKDVLSFYKKSFEETLKNCNQDVHEFVERMVNVEVCEYDTKYQTGSIIKKYQDLVYNSKNEMEKYEELLRYDLYHLLQELKSEFNHEPLFTNKEIKLKFGLDPLLDYVGNGEEKYQRQDESKDMMHDRLLMETNQYLLEWLSNVQ